MTTRLQAARLARDLTQSQVIAEMIRRADGEGVSLASRTSLKTLMSSFENGRRSVGEPYRSLFRAIYGMTDSELFGKQGDEPVDASGEEYGRLAA